MTTKLEALIDFIDSVAGLLPYITDPTRTTLPNPQGMLRQLQGQFMAVTTAQELGSPSDNKVDLERATSNLEKGIDLVRKIKDGLVDNYPGWGDLINDINNVENAIRNGSGHDIGAAGSILAAGLLGIGIGIVGGFCLGGPGLALAMAGAFGFWYLAGKAMANLEAALLDMLFPNPDSLPIDPLVVDLNGDGVQLISVAQSKVNFDFDGDGFRERAGWVSAQDGLLVRDLNGNGRIESLQELIGTATQDAYSVLRGMDGNADGQITAADAVWSTLKVWQDANSDGLTDAGELKTLAELGITEFNLGGTSVGQRVNGNFIHSRSTIVMNGQTNESQAVFFDTARNIAIFTPPAGFVPHPDAAKLPNLGGGGGTPSLSRACSALLEASAGHRLAA